jgi:hypothetical protein
MPLINRTTKIQTLTIANGANLSDEFDMRDYAGGNLYMPAAWTAASIGIKVSTSPGGTYYPLYDNAGDIIEIDGPAVDKAYQLPRDMFGCTFVKLWSQDGAGANTNQGAERTIVIEIKS